MLLDRLRIPIIQAPLAGGASTPGLTAAVLKAGAFGFLASGYRTTDDVAAEIAELRGLTRAPYGLNIFVPGGEDADPGAVAPYLDEIAGEADRHGVVLGEPRYDDDAFAAKVELAIVEQVPAVSFTFGCPDAGLVRRLHAAGSEVWVTVTEPGEAQQAAAAGADAVIAQGAEAGGHRGGFLDRHDRVDYGLLVLLQLLKDHVDLPLVATGGVATGAAVAAILCAGAQAAQLGTAFLRCPEAGTSPTHRAALSEPGHTRLTRAFTGRAARGIENRFLVEHSAAAPVAYPQIHHATAQLRAAGRAAGDRDVVNLWAGQAYRIAEEIPAADFVARLGRDLTTALAVAGRRIAAVVDDESPASRPGPGTGRD